MKLCIHLFCKVLMLYHRRSNMAADLLSLFLLSSTEHQNRFGGALSSLRMCPWDFRKHACWSSVDNFSFHYQRISAKWCAISCEKRGWRPLKQGFLCVLWKQKMGKYKSVRYVRDWQTSKENLDMSVATIDLSNMIYSHYLSGDCASRLENFKRSHCV